MFVPFFSLLDSDSKPIAGTHFKTWGRNFGFLESVYINFWTPARGVARPE